MWASTTTEEVNVAVRGANYGWPIAEGVSSTPGLTNPIFTYPHSGHDAAITGGVVYRGSQFPASYQGTYFYGDYAQNWIRYLTLDAAGNVTASVNFEPADGTLDSQSVGDPVMLKVGPDGALYYVDFGWSPAENPAAIRRIRYTAFNQPPTVSVTATPAGPSGSVSFSSAGSFDPEGQPLSFLWHFGDGTTSTEANPTHFYQQDGMYSAQLALSDGVNTTHSEVINVAIGNAPTGTITSPSSGTLFRAGETINFAGTATDPEDGLLPASAYSWSVLFHHDSHVHPAITALQGVTNGSFTIPMLGHDFDSGTNYEIILTVTDSDGLQHRSSVFIDPELVNVTFNSIPTGLTLNIGGIDQTAPVTRNALVGFHYTISAPNQPAGGYQYSFISWSDGGAQTHAITVPETAQTFAATYEAGSSPPPPNQVTALSFGEGSGTAAADNSGSGHNGTLVNGPTWTAGKFGNGLSLDGANDYVSVANPATLNFGTSNFTIALWLKRQATSVEHTIFSKTANGSWASGGKEFFINGTDNRLGFGSLGRGEVFSTGTVTNDGQWHHVAVTFVDSSNTITFYIDGVASGSGTLNLLADVASHVVKLGGHPAGHYFRGQVDEFRIFSRTLSPSEVQSTMNNAIPPSPDTTPPVRSNGQPSGVLAVGTTQAILSLATNENATARYSTLPGTAYAAMTGTFLTTGGTSHSTTVSGLADGTTYTYYVRSIDASGNANTNDFAISFSVASPPPNTVQLTVNNGTGSGYYPVNSVGIPVSANSPPPGQQFEMWIDDKEILENFLQPNTTATIPSIPVTVTATYKALPKYALTVNSGTGTGDYTAGTPVAVTASAAPAGQQFAGWTGDVQFLTGSTSSPNNTVTMPSQPVTIAATYQPVPTFPLVVNNGTGSGSYAANTPVLVTANAAPAGQQFSAWVGDVQFLASATSSSTTVTMPSQPVTITATYQIVTAPPNQVAALAFSEGTGTTAADSSGSGHGGTLVNGPTWTAGKFGNGVSLDGTNDYVSVANPSTLNFGTSNFTLALWIKRQATGVEHTIFSKTANASWGSGGKEFFINASNNRLGFGGFGIGELFSTGTITNDGLWHHVALTFVDSSNTITFYIDGVASGSGTLNLSADVGSHVVKLGGHPSGHYFRGQVDEFRIFNRALSASEVQTTMTNAIQPPAP